MVLNLNPFYWYACMYVCECVCLLHLCVYISLGCYYWWLWGKVNGPWWLPECVLSWAGTNRSFRGERERISQGVCGERILNFDLEGQKGTALRSFLSWDLQQMQKKMMSCENHQLCWSLWVTHSGPKPRVGFAPSVSMSNEMVKWCVMLHAADPREPLSTADFIFSPLVAFWSVTYQQNGHWDHAGNWQFKDVLTPASLPDCPKSKKSGCTTKLQNQNL